MQPSDKKNFGTHFSSLDMALQFADDTLWGHHVASGSEPVSLPITLISDACDGYDYQPLKHVDFIIHMAYAGSTS